METTDHKLRRRSKIPRTLQCTDPGLNQYYYSRKHSSRISTNDLPLELGAVGFYSPWAFLWFCLFMVAPLAYVYILLMLLRDLCLYFPENVYQPLQKYAPFLAWLADYMKTASRMVDVWCVIEALFFIACKLKIQYLQSKDPLEASLSAAPMLDSEDRKLLWDRIIDIEQHDPMAFISGWFFDQPIQRISRYDVCDFICWSMFDGRNQEHLTTQELHELECFVEDLEYRISLKLYGQADFEDKDIDDHDENACPNESQAKSVSPSGTTTKEEIICEAEDEISSSSEFSGTPGRPWPKKRFRFSKDRQREEPNFFMDLFESYRHRYEQYKNMVENADFHPVQDFRNIIAETAHHAEESAMATAHSMYETIIQPGSSMDKQLSALTNATSAQLTEAWNSVKGMKERIETATFLSEQRKSLMQQLRGNRAMLARMREMSYAVPSKQMAALMRKITESYDALERIEARARDGFVHATGVFADTKNAIFTRNEPQRFARYSSDPLLGIATYPLGFHLLVLGASEIPLRILLRRRGFEKRCIGPVSYYYHSGISDDDEQETYNYGLPKSSKKAPIVFIHGIGIGIIAYIPLIDLLLKSGRPIFLPEIPYVSGFRPWISPNSVLSPAVVASTMTAMLATHGFSNGVFMGHSYGTSWLSYVCKFAPSAVAALLFLDPVCFCLHYSRLTKNFVYHRPDPGTISFMVRTDMTINWTIQRAFPWAWITLFVDQVDVPCIVFLSDKDALVPVENVEAYFRAKQIPICDAKSINQEFLDKKEKFKSCVFRGHIHGDFTEQLNLLPPIVIACNDLCLKAESSG